MRELVEKKRETRRRTSERMRWNVARTAQSSSRHFIVQFPLFLALSVCIHLIDKHSLCGRADIASSHLEGRGGEGR